MRMGPSAKPSGPGSRSSGAARPTTRRSAARPCSMMWMKGLSVAPRQSVRGAPRHSGRRRREPVRAPAGSPPARGRTGPARRGYRARTAAPGPPRRRPRSNPHRTAREAGREADAVGCGLGEIHRDVDVGVAHGGLLGTCRPARGSSVGAAVKRSLDPAQRARAGPRPACAASGFALDQGTARRGAPEVAGPFLRRPRCPPSNCPVQSTSRELNSRSRSSGTSCFRPSPSACELSRGARGLLAADREGRLPRYLPLLAADLRHRLRDGRRLGVWS